MELGIITAAFVITNVAWMYAGYRLIKAFEEERYVLLERIQRPEYPPMKQDPNVQEALFENDTDEYAGVGQVVNLPRGDE